MAPHRFRGKADFRRINVQTETKGSLIGDFVLRFESSLAIILRKRLQNLTSGGCLGQFHQNT